MDLFDASYLALPDANKEMVLQAVPARHVWMIYGLDPVLLRTGEEAQLIILGKRTVILGHVKGPIIHSRPFYMENGETPVVLRDQ